MNWEGAQLTACVQYALGLEGGGGMYEDKRPPPQGMLPEVFVELLEMLVPKWDPARWDKPLGRQLEDMDEDHFGWECDTMQDM